LDEPNNITITGIEKIVTKTKTSRTGNKGNRNRGNKRKRNRKGNQEVTSKGGGRENSNSTTLPKGNPKGIALYENGSTGIDRIYYINLKKNTDRRDKMEAWLSQQPIPYQRIEASVGTENHTCQPKYININRPRCRGIVGVALSNIDIIDHYNTSGFTLVMEDDYIIARMPLLLAALNDDVPPDFDVVRLNCWSRPHPDFVQFDGGIFRSACAYAGNNNTNPSSCINNQGWYCGGAHAVLWRGSSVQKLREIWSEEPFADIDCRLTTDKIQSYCIKGRWDIGWSIKKIEGEETNIPH
jgi:hypothetical protein